MPKQKLWNGIDITQPTILNQWAHYSGEYTKITKPQLFIYRIVEAFLNIPI